MTNTRAISADVAGVAGAVLPAVGQEDDGDLAGLVGRRADEIAEAGDPFLGQEGADAVAPSSVTSSATITKSSLKTMSMGIGAPVTGVPLRLEFGIRRPE